MLETTDGMPRDHNWSYRRTFILLSLTGVASWAALGFIVWRSLLR